MLLVRNCLVVDDLDWFGAFSTRGFWCLKLREWCIINTSLELIFFFVAKS
jgi:hypothetical protein